MWKNNKTKILTSICVPAAALGSVGIAAGIVLGIKQNKQDDIVTPYGEGNLTATFSAGEGKFTGGHTVVKFNTGSKLEQIPQPKVSADGKIFAGWKDEATGQILRGSQKIDYNKKLTATYQNANDSNYIKITFSLGSWYSTGTIEGPTEALILKNSPYFMLNRPNAVYNNYYFLGWAKQTVSEPTKADLLKETDILSTATTLVPVFQKLVTVTYYQVEGQWSGGKISPTVLPGTKFKEVNPPTFINGIKYIEGFYKNYDSDTNTYSNKWDENETIQTDCKAYAKWVESGELVKVYATLNFMNKDTDGNDVGYHGNTNFAMKKSGTKWGEINKPIGYRREKVSESWVEKSTHQVVGWQWCLTSDGTFTDITDNSTLADLSITESHKNVYIKPKMQLITGPVHLYTTDAATTSSSTTQQSVVPLLPGKTINLTAFMDAECEQTFTWTKSTNFDNYATLTNATGESDDSPHKVLTLKANLKTTTTDEISVTVKSKVDTQKAATMTINLTMPFANSLKIWTYRNNAWYSIDEDTLYNPKSDIGLIDLNGNPVATKVTRSAFNSPVYVGDKIVTIPHNFLANCTGFNSDIIFNKYQETSTSTPAFKLKNIGNNFLAGCTTFNKKLELPSTTEYIGFAFLANCSDFGKEVSGYTDRERLVLPTTINYIEDDFLFNCSNFVGKLGWGSTGTVVIPAAMTNIGQNFLAGCSSFNTSIDLSTVTNDLTIGGHFMYGCNAFTSNLKLSAKDKFVQESYTLSATVSDASLASTGFTVSSEDNSHLAFCASYPTVSDDYSKIFRRNKSCTRIEIPSTQISTLIINTATEIDVKCFLDSDAGSATPTYISPTSFTILGDTGATITKSTTRTGNQCFTITTKAVAGHAVIRIVCNSRTVDFPIVISETQPGK